MTSAAKFTDYYEDKLEGGGVLCRKSLAHNNKHLISIIMIIIIIIIIPTFTIWRRGEWRGQGKVWHCLVMGAAS